MKPLEIYTELEDGSLKEAQLTRLLDYIGKLGNGFVYIYVDKKRERSSTKQRGYYRAVILQTLEDHSDVGYTADEWHDVLKEMFLSHKLHDENGDPIIGEDGVPISQTFSTESLDTKEREEYHEKIRRWASLQGWYIPEPNEK